MREKVLDFLLKEINLGHIPGAVISVSYQDKVILKEAIGDRVVYPDKAPMKMETVFDLASLTKVVATFQHGDGSPVSSKSIGSETREPSPCFPMFHL